MPAQRTLCYKEEPDDLFDRTQNEMYDTLPSLWAFGTCLCHEDEDFREEHDEICDKTPNVMYDTLPSISAGVNVCQW